MSFNVISFLKSTLGQRGAIPVADDQPLPTTPLLGGSAISSSNPLPVYIPQGASAQGAYTQANVSFSSSGENTVVSSTASTVIRTYALALTAASPVDMTIKDAASGNTLAVFSGVTTLVLEPFPNGSPLFTGATSGAMIISLSSGVAVKGSIWYIKA